MKIERKAMFILLICIIFLVNGCTTQEPKVEEEIKPFFSYVEFRNLFSDMVQELAIEQYEKIAQTTDDNLIAIDKESSFGQRKFLTVDGTQDYKETQERIAYFNKDMNVLMFIDLIYLKQNLSNDLLFVKPDFIDVNDYGIYSYKSQNTILSFHNILIQITLVDNNEDKKAELLPVMKVTNEVVKYLENYDITTSNK
ncbi:hypothetical protein [Paenibacillus sp. KS-LC4]|uniref:hypothetical protein n=1 Tax=Paenibacillus sp. KS-LC4 TaxID=2979727 RepID=UPI0030CC68D7